MNPTVSHFPKDYRSWSDSNTNPKVEISNLNYLIFIRDSAKSGLGFGDNRHLNYFVESINMNVGDSYQNVNPTSATRAKKIGKLLILRSRIFKGRHYKLDFLVRR